MSVRVRSVGIVNATLANHNVTTTSDMYVCPSFIPYLFDVHGGSRQDVVVGHGVLIKVVDKVCLFVLVLVLVLVL